VYLPVPDDVLRAIGDVTVSFAALEDAVQSFVRSMLAEHQRVGQIITAELPFKGSRALASSLYLERHGEDDDYAALRRLLRRAEGMEERRNQIIHSVWAAGDKPHTVTRIKMTAKERRGAHFAFSEMSATDIEAIASEMRDIAAALHRFNFDLIERNKAINNPFRPLWGPRAAPDGGAAD
jgi:hypothetical protein